MDALSSAVAPNQPPVAATKIDSFDNYSNLQMSPEHTKAKEEALKKSVSDRVKVNFELEQANFEGVDENEWDEE